MLTARGRRNQNILISGEGNFAHVPFAALFNLNLNIGFNACAAAVVKLCASSGMKSHKNERAKKLVRRWGASTICAHGNMLICLILHSHWNRGCGKLFNYE